MAKSVSHTAAIGYALAGFTLWVLTDACIKHAAEASIPPYEIIGFLSLIGALSILAKELPKRSLKKLWPTRPRTQLALAVSGLVVNLLNVVALKHLPLTIFYIVVFTAPMMIALLAACFLGERLGIAKAIAIAAGFLGVVVAVDSLHAMRGGDAIGYAAGIASALSFSVNIILSRTIAQSESITSMTFFNGFIQALFCLIPVLYHFVPLPTREMAILLVAGFLNVLGILATFKALKHTTAATVSQFHYTQIITGAMIGLLVWHEIPTLHLIAGALIIIASGLYIAAHAKRAENVASVSPH